jgi:dTMP kinase
LCLYIIRKCEKLKSLLISFEGIDGAGKTTQINLLSKYLESKGLSVVVLREPGGNDVSESIREILLSAKNSINPKTELLLFEAARSELVHSVIIPALENGKIVLLDRFYDSTTAYQGFGRGLPLDDISKLNDIATSGLKPDLTFFLDIPLEVSKERSKKRDLDRIELSGSVFFERIIEGFRHLASLNSERIFLIDSEQDVKTVQNFIIFAVETKINLS